MIFLCCLQICIMSLYQLLYVSVHILKIADVKLKLKYIYISNKNVAMCVADFEILVNISCLLRNLLLNRNSEKQCCYKCKHLPSNLRTPQWMHNKEPTHDNLTRILSPSPRSRGQLSRKINGTWRKQRSLREHALPCLSPFLSRVSGWVETMSV